MILTKDEEKNMKEVISCLEKEIERMEKKVKEVRDLKCKLQSKLWRQFSCPLGKTDKDAICPKCSKALAKVGTGWDGKEHILWFQLPPGMSKNLVEQCEKSKAGCTEWDKKTIMVACGCGGNFICECGYEEGFCSFIGEEKTCPFCGRIVKVERSGTMIMAGVGISSKKTR